MTDSAVAEAPRVERCCVCDKANVFTNCDQCGEPVCLGDLRAVRLLERTRWFCAVCFIEGPAELEASRPYPIGGTP